MPKSTWRETSIYKVLTSKGENSVSILLNNPKVMDAIETILDSGGTTPKDFTLHDSNHSFRVAQRIWEIIPESTKDKLSTYELGLSLMSAYLHDIGMSPDFNKVARHYKFLSSNDKDCLSAEEINELQKWVDNDYHVKALDIRKEIIDNNSILNYILSYYIRNKHNDWSGEWIEKNLSGIPLDNYHLWVDDLVKVCKSHHYGIEVLKTDSFNPKPIDSISCVHLRFLAMCLRVADVMENDPERTPNVILKHRLISNSSLNYWLKDHRFNLIRKDNGFTIYSRPEKAYLHKAIEETAGLIENELKLCNELKNIRPLNHSSFGDLHQYLWELESVVLKDIIPKDGTYVYIQGAFKPNTAKILELLGGNQLYGNPKWAYRELIQNSFDSVKERIAYQVIEQIGAHDDLSQKLGEIYSVEILLDKRADGYWLVCKDTGVGMTKNIIEKFFLESGSSKRHEIQELERKCKEKKFHFGRTGQFGIGVLSYFMLAEKIVIKTKRELNTGYADEDSQAWRFEINGTHDFGELSRYKKPINGTQIELKLKQSIEKDIEKWDKEFSSSVKKVVAKSPCTLSYNSMFIKEKVITSHGWTKNINDIKEKISELLNVDSFITEKSNSEIISINEKNKIRINNSLASEISDETITCIDFLHGEGKINGLGSYRLHIPFYKLKKGNCFFFLKETVTKSQHLISKINKGFFWAPNFSKIHYSLKGINININSTNSHDPINNYNNLIVPSAFIEVDIEEMEEKSLSVSRHVLTVGENFEEIKKTIDKLVLDVIDKNKNKFDNCYGSLNYQFTKEVPNNKFWLIEDGKESKQVYEWRKITYPISLLSEYSIKPESYLFKKKEIMFIRPIKNYLNESLQFFDNEKFDFTLGIRGSTNYLFFGVTIFFILRGERKNELIEFNTIETPESWKDVLFIQSKRSQILLNTTHPLLKHYDSNAYKSMVDSGLSISINEIQTKKQSFAFLLYAAINFYKKWTGLYESNHPLIVHAFKTLRIKSFMILEDSKLLKISPKEDIDLSEDLSIRSSLANNANEFSIQLRKKPPLAKKNRKLKKLIT
jgi:hypothetical protein